MTEFSISPLCYIHTEITHEPIDLSFLSRIGTQYPECGAISTFMGITRNNYQNKIVVQLEYEAYIPMALKEMHLICTNTVHKYNTVVSSDAKVPTSNSTDCLSCQHRENIRLNKDPEHSHHQHHHNPENNIQDTIVKNLVSSSTDKETVLISSPVTHPTEGLRYLYVVHRLGIVPVGEVSIAIIGMSPHRASAINGVHDIINEIKATVPIWKKEIYKEDSSLSLSSSSSCSNGGGGGVWKANSECRWNQ